MLLLLLVISLLALGFLIAAPLWQTQIQREKEEELIFRGGQFVEAVRLFQQKMPGSFPKSLDELFEEKCIRRLYTDPMTPHGEWNLIMPYQRIAAPTQRETRSGFDRIQQREARSGNPLARRETTQAQGRPEGAPSALGQIQKILIVPLSALGSVPDPQILGVVSASTNPSFKLYYDQDSYDKWLFYYGADPENPPEIVYYGEEDQN